jgi:cell division protein ZapE
MAAVLDRYHALIAGGELKPDPDQARAIGRLDTLAVELSLPESGGLFGKLLGRKSKVPARALHVGRRRARQIHADGPVLRLRR